MKSARCHRLTKDILYYLKEPLINGGLNYKGPKVAKFLGR